MTPRRLSAVQGGRILGLLLVGFTAVADAQLNIWSAPAPVIATLPRNVMFYNTKNQLIATIHLDSGKIELGPGASSDEASRDLWEVLQGLYPLPSRGPSPTERECLRLLFETERKP